jgi:hypothetical protein
MKFALFVLTAQRACSHPHRFKGDMSSNILEMYEADEAADDAEQMLREEEQNELNETVDESEKSEESEDSEESEREGEEEDDRDDHVAARVVPKPAAESFVQYEYEWGETNQKT